MLGLKLTEQIVKITSFCFSCFAKLQNLERKKHFTWIAYSMFHLRKSKDCIRKNERQLHVWSEKWKTNIMSRKVLYELALPEHKMHEASFFYIRSLKKLAPILKKNGSLNWENAKYIERLAESKKRNKQKRPNCTIGNVQGFDTKSTVCKQKKFESIH